MTQVAESNPDIPAAKGDSLWYSKTAEDAARNLEVNLDTGLSDSEAAQRMDRFGPNELRREKVESFWERVAEEAREPMILFLLVTGIFYGIVGGVVDALVIFGVIFTLVTVEVVNESRADKAIGALQKLAEPTASGSPRRCPKRNCS